MSMPLFSGVCTALVTPFYEGRVNYAMMTRLIQRQLDAGIRAFVICGTTGEAPTLSDEEKITLFRHAKKCVGNQGTIIAGTGSNDTAHAVKLSMAAEETGVDGLLVVTPYYNKATAEGLFLHYQTISDSVHIPIIVYNVPSRTGVDIPVAVYKQLAQIPNIAGVKEASSDITKILKILSACPKDFTVWSGNDDQIVPSMAVGGRGIISVLSNVEPEKTKDMAEAALAGDFDTAAALQIEMLPLIEMLFSQVNPIPVKAAMKILGYDCGKCRLPLCDVSDDLLIKMKRYFE